MKKRTVMGVHAPPARPTPLLVAFVLALLSVVIIALGLAIDPYLAPFFVGR